MPHTSDNAGSAKHVPEGFVPRRQDRVPSSWSCDRRGMLSIHQTSTKQKRCQEKDTGREEEVVNQLGSWGVPLGCLYRPKNPHPPPIHPMPGRRLKPPRPHQGRSFPIHRRIPCRTFQKDVTHRPILIDPNPGRRWLQRICTFHRGKLNRFGRFSLP